MAIIELKTKKTKLINKYSIKIQFKLYFYLKKMLFNSEVSIYICCEERVEIFYGKNHHKGSPEM